MILLFALVVVEYPITVRVNNVRAILVLGNTLALYKANHIDMRHHFVLDYIEDGAAKIEIFHSEENIVDQFTKNLSNGHLTCSSEGKYTVMKHFKPSLSLFYSHKSKA